MIGQYLITWEDNDPIADEYVIQLGGRNLQTGKSLVYKKVSMFRLIW